jgi:chromosome transmission fidelity protein 18
MAFAQYLADCFATYPTKEFNDDSILTKPNAVYEWLYFADQMSSRFHGEASGASYLTYPILAFHHLFASSTSPSKESEKPDTEEPSLPFTGLSADWEAYEAQKEHTSMLSAIHASLSSIRLSQTFKNPAAIAMELSPLVNRMLSPQINPVLVSGSGYAVASVRRDSEKRLVSRAVDAMEAVGVRFEKVRVEGPTAGAGWAFRMDPPLDVVGMYATYAAPTREPVRYAVRQALSQEFEKAQMLREKAAREARMGVVNGSTPTVEEEKEVREDMRKEKKKLRRDFFGRVVEDGPVTEDDGPRKKRRVEGEKRDVWVSYNEGFSNAVRKGIGLDELMEGLI